MANLYRTISSTNSSWTFSTWMKISINSSNQYFFQFGGDSGSSRVGFYISGATKAINMYVEATTTLVDSTNLLRDPAAWYHVVIKNNAGTGTVYVNGTALAGSLASFTCPSLSAAQLNVGYGFNTLPWYGGLAHTHLADGTAYDPTTFAETDATSGIWIAKSGPSVTYGTDGFFLKYASGAITTDSSGNGNTMTQSGTITANKDNPDNNFATMNPLDNYYAASTFTNADTTVTTSSGNSTFNTATVPLQAGKWYAEMKCGTPFVTYTHLGIGDKISTATGDSPGASAQEYTYLAYDGNQVSGGSGSAYGDSYTTGDIIGVYIDLDNLKLYFAKNGTVQNSGTGITISALTSTENGWYDIIFGDEDGGGSTTGEFNFGNGYFGTTVVTSGVADAGGEGTFEYDPSAGTFDGSSKDFRAICTNNIATYG